MSLWDDSEANMLWLDSDYPLNKDPSIPGVNRGPCRTDTGSPEYLRGTRLRRNGNWCCVVFFLDGCSPFSALFKSRICCLHLACF